MSSLNWATFYFYVFFIKSTKIQKNPATNHRIGAATHPGALQGKSCSGCFTELWLEPKAPEHSPGSAEELLVAVPVGAVQSHQKLASHFQYAEKDVCVFCEQARCVFYNEEGRSLDHIRLPPPTGDYAPDFWHARAAPVLLRARGDLGSAAPELHNHWQLLGVDCSNRTATLSKRELRGKKSQICKCTYVEKHAPGDIFKIQT